MENKIMLFEDFAKMYKIWKNKEVFRREQGVMVKSKFGNMVLHNPHCKYDDLIKELLDVEYNMSTLGVSFYHVNDISDKEDIKNIIDGNDSHRFPVGKIKNPSRVFVMSALRYDLIEDEIDTDEICYEDYRTICKCVADYLGKNVNITKLERDGKDYGDYKLLLYSGAEYYGFDIDVFTDEFKNLFQTEVKYTESKNGKKIKIAVDISYENVEQYKKMKKFTKDWLNS